MSNIGADPSGAKKAEVILSEHQAYREYQRLRSLEYHDQADELFDRYWGEDGIYNVAEDE